MQTPCLDDVLSDKYPRAFSYAKEEDASVKNFLASSSLSEAFHTPISPQAFAEVCNLQTDTALVELNLQPTVHDKWVCIWGKEDYTSTKYYDHYFRDVQMHPT